MYRQCLIKIACVVSCLMRCQSESICISIRRLTVLKALRTLEDTAGQIVSQIMLRGLCKRWKQPVAYYLTRGSTKGDTLVDFLMEVLDACHNAGLVVVATLCDMGANNVKALKQLGVSEKTPFFRFHHQEIAAVFDPSHLLKCPHILFLKHEMMNVGLGVFVNGQPLTGTAKWADILKVYNLTKRMCCIVSCVR